MLSDKQLFEQYQDKPGEQELMVLPSRDALSETDYNYYCETNPKFAKKFKKFTPTHKATWTYKVEWSQVGGLHAAVYQSNYRIVELTNAK